MVLLLVFACYTFASFIALLLFNYLIHLLKGLFLLYNLYYDIDIQKNEKRKYENI